MNVKKTYLADDGKENSELLDPVIRQSASREAWIGVGGIFIVHFFYGGLLKSMTMFYPYWQLEYNVNNAQVSVVFSAFAFAMQVGAFLSQYTGMGLESGCTS